MAPLQAIAVYGRMIKFSHSVFALPFAFSGALLAATVHWHHPRPDRLDCVGDGGGAQRGDGL